MSEPKSKVEIERTKKANQKFLEAAQSTEVPVDGKQVTQFRFADGTTMHMGRDEYEMRLFEQRQKLATHETVARAAVANSSWEESHRKSDQTKEQHARSNKGKAKVAVQAEWNKWRVARGKGRWRAAFARKMLESYPVLENQKTIENWAKSWEDAYAKIEE